MIKFGFSCVQFASCGRYLAKSTNSLIRISVDSGSEFCGDHLSGETHPSLAACAVGDVVKGSRSMLLGKHRGESDDDHARDKLRRRGSGE